jgi:hypothetical protein
MKKIHKYSAGFLFVFNARQRAKPFLVVTADAMQNTDSRGGTAEKATGNVNA